MDRPDYIHIYQIFYDDESRAALDPAYIPLDNSSNERSDWFEFWPIRLFLHRTRLEPDHWYGFLSPRFTSKTGILSDRVYDLVRRMNRAGGDVAMVSPGWAQLAYFRNVFEQGDFWHPGLTAAFQDFVEHAGTKVNVAGMVTHTSNSGFSNYLIAKPAYWKIWLSLADRLFAYVESGTAGAAGELTSYGSARRAPMKTFLQERISALLLSTGRFNVAALDQSDTSPPSLSLMFNDDTATRRTLQVLDFLKRKYTETGDVIYLQAFERIRPDIAIVPGYEAMLPWRRATAEASR